MKPLVLFAAITVSLVACTRDPGFVRVSGVREATPAEVTQCRYISDFRMTPGVYGVLADQGLKYARNKIMADARESGANAIVFDQVSPGGDVYEVHAVAYEC